MLKVPANIKIQSLYNNAVIALFVSRRFVRCSRYNNGLHVVLLIVVSNIPLSLLLSLQHYFFTAP